MRLRTRIFASHVVPATLGALLLSGYMLYSFRGYILERDQADLEARAIALSESVGDALESGDTARVAVVVQRYGAQEDIWLRVLSSEARLLASSSFEEDGRVQDWRAVPGVAEAFAGTPTMRIARGLRAEDDRISETRPIVRRGRVVGVLRLSRSLASFQRHFTRATASVVAALLAILALCAVLSAKLAGTLAAPVRAMRDFALAVGAGRFDARLPEGRADEIGELAASLNGMSARLSALDQERRAFLANASHELRTPVTNVSATLEALESGAADDPGLREKFLRTALGETQRMTRLIEAMLDLGQLEAGVSAIERRAVHLGQLVERSAEPVRPRFTAAGVTLAITTSDAWVEGDPDRLHQVLLNLLDNALKYAPPGSTVRLDVRADGNEACVEVRDRGGGISAEDLPHVFDQFYAAGRSRRRGGTGLGLAISRRIVQAHGGSLSAANEEGGAVLTLRLPRRDPPSTPAAAA